MKQLSTCLFILASLLGIAQNKYEPQILILAPNATSFDKVFESEISGYDAEIKSQAKERLQPTDTPDFKSAPENVQRIITSQNDFLPHLDFFNQVTFFSLDFLSNLLQNRFPGELILLKNIKSSGTAEGLKKIAANEHMRYVLNFSLVEIYKENEISYCRITAQFYDHQSNTLLINKTFTGSWNNKGGEQTCAEKTLGCSLANATYASLWAVIGLLINEGE